jgi:hypothetical protein
VSTEGAGVRGFLAGGSRKEARLREQGGLSMAARPALVTGVAGIGKSRRRRSF